MFRLFALALAACSFAATARGAEVAYYPLPNDAYPHDVAPAADGTVWYSGQHLGVLGRFDPKTQEAEHIPLGPHSAPHGVIIGPDRAIWLTDGGQNAIVRVDPASRAVRVLPLPSSFPNANLNTAVFDPAGVLWFTGQSGVYGRVDPLASKLETWRSPKGAGPYGITSTPTGQVWYASLAGDHIARIDGSGGGVTVIDPPRPGVGPRRIWSDSRGMLWVSFWNSGEIGRYDPGAGAWKTWSLPNSKSGCYAIYVDDGDRIWVSDWTANAILRFDPKIEMFVSFPSNRTRADVRQLAGRRGEVWGGETGTDRLAVVRE